MLGDKFLVLVQNALKHALAYLSERLILVVLANCKVYVVSINKLLKNSHEHFLEPKHFFVLVVDSQRLGSWL